jgi:hypothetical protein
MNWKSILCCFQGKKEALLSLEEEDIFNDNTVQSTISIEEPNNTSSTVSV